MGFMLKEIKDLRAGVNTTRQKDGQNEFGQTVKKAIGSLGIPASATPLEGAEFMEEFARDLFLSYDDADHDKLRGGEFDKILKARFEGIRKYVKAVEKAELAAANERKRGLIFNRKGGHVTPGGKAKAPLDNQALADALFASSTSQSSM
jgi:hypothetical protein